MSRPTVDVRGLDPTDRAFRTTLEPIVALLAADGLAALPTATVYGFGGRLSPPALEALRRLKGRGPSRPFLVLVDSVSTLDDLMWSDAARELASVFWPGALTLVLPDPHGRYPAAVRSATGGVAVRHTAHPVPRAVIDALGEPVTSTSANAPGAAPAADVEGVRTALSTLAASVPEAVEVGWVDAGRLAPSAPSTVVDCTGVRPRVLREGAIPIARLRCVLPELSPHD